MKAASAVHRGLVGAEVFPFLDHLAVWQMTKASLAIHAISDFHAAALLHAKFGCGIGYTGLRLRFGGIGRGRGTAADNREAGCRKRMRM